MEFSYTIGERDLKPGQWIVFSHDSEPVPKERIGPFKVISREDDYWEFCRCLLMNGEGHTIDYCPRVLSSLLPCGYKVRVITKETVSKEFGLKIEELHLKAIEHLKRIAHKNLCNTVWFNPDNENTPLKTHQVLEKYNLT